MITFLRCRTVLKYVGIFLFFFTLLFPATELKAQKIWTLQESIEYALEHNITIKQVQISAEIAKVNFDQSKATFLPSFNASGSYGYNFGRSVDIFTYEFTTQEIRSANFSVTGNMTIFNGLQIQRSLAQSKYEYMAGDQNVKKIKEDIALNVAAAYLQVLYARESLKAAEDRLEAATETRDRTKLLVDAGSMARGNLLDAEAALSAEELNVITNENLLKSATISITQLLELPSPEGFVVADPENDLPEQSSLALTPDDIYSTALTVLPEVQVSELNIKSAEQGLMLSKGGRSPRLSLYGSINSGYSNNYQRITGEKVPFQDQIDENFNKSIGLNLSIPIFNGWSVNSNVKRSRLNLENVRYNDEITRNEIYKSIVQAHSDAKAALLKYSSSEKAKASAIEAYDYAEKKYNVGLISSIEFLNVRNFKSESESNFIQAKYDLIFRLKILDFYLGKPLSF